MNTMGSTCSMQRDYDNMSARLLRRSEMANEDLYEELANENAASSSLRHAVVKPISDNSFSNLYPIEDNYVVEESGLRSPKSLADLATEALCRSLPYLDGELPPMPQECVDHIITSLADHSAINAAALRALRNNEIGFLSLAGCRGVTDEWLAPLSVASSCSPHSSPETSPNFSPLLSSTPDNMVQMDLDLEVKHSAGNGYQENKILDSSLDDASSTSFLTSFSDHEKVKDTDSDLKMPFGIQPLLSTSVTSNLTFLDLSGSQRLSDNGLLQLSNLHALEIARLDHCHAITGPGLQAFSSSHRLHSLSLAHCRRMTDDGIHRISHLLSIENISLEGCRCLTDQSLISLADMVGLRKLDLGQCDLITDDGLVHLEDIDGLEELSLGWCSSVSDSGIDAITRPCSRSKRLRVLRLARCSKLTDTGVEYLGRLSVLEELDLNGCRRVSSQALGKTLGRLKHLTVLDVSFCPDILNSDWNGRIDSLASLELRFCQLDDQHLMRFSWLGRLEELNLDSCEDITDQGLRHLVEVAPNMKSLDLSECEVTDSGVACLSNLTRLKRLSLFYCAITNRGLRSIGKILSLETLNLDSRDISDEGLRHLRGLSNLKHLDIFSGRISDAGCGYICRIETLESLDLCGGGIGDLGCSLLACLTHLSSLNLSQNERIGNRGAAALAALSELKTLNLSHTRVTGSALRFFSGLRKLKSLSLYGCDGLRDSHHLSQLKAVLPNLKCVRADGVQEDEGMYIPRRNKPTKRSFGGQESEVEDMDVEWSSESIYSDHSD